MALATTSLTTTEVQRQLRGTGPDWKGVAFRSACFTALLLSLAVLVILLWTVLSGSIDTFSERGLDFITSGTSKDPAAAGVWQALWGSFWIGVIVIVLAFPLGIAAAIYLEEYEKGGRLARIIDVNIRNLAGVPSIVYGILGFAIFVKATGGFTGGASVISGGVTLAILVLPIVIITSAEALRAVPDSIREAGFGVGASRWEVVRSHVLPYAAPGILTGTILSLARALGEAAPLILVGAKTGFFSQAAGEGFVQQLQDAFTAMPIIVFDWARQPRDEFRALTAAAIVVMLIVVLSANAVAILLRNHFEKKRHA